MKDWNKIGHDLLINKEYEQAAEAFNHAIEEAPQDPVGYNNFGNLLMSMNEVARSVAFFEKALELQSDYGPALYSYGNALYELDKYDQAIEAFQLAEKSGVKNDGDLHFMLGMSYVNLGQLMMALVHLQRSVELNEQDLDARFQYALCLAKLGHIELSLENLNHIVQQRPNDADAHYNRGVALIKLGKHNEAMDAFTQALASQSDHMLAANGLKQLKAFKEKIKEDKSL